MTEATFTFACQTEGCRVIEVTVVLDAVGWTADGTDPGTPPCPACNQRMLAVDIEDEGGRQYSYAQFIAALGAASA